MNPVIAAIPASIGRKLTALGVSRQAALVVLGCTLLVCALTELWYLTTDQPVGFDEGYIGGMALRLLNGGMLPGVDGVGQRGPVFYWLAAISQWLVGRYHWAGMRWLAWAAATAVVLGLFWMGALRRRPLAGALGGAFYAYTIFNVYDAGGGIAVNGEQIVAPFACWATVATVAAGHARKNESRLRWLFFAGFLAAIAGWTKVSFLPVVLPLGLWVLVARSPEPGRQLTVLRVRELTCLSLGWLLPLLFILVVYGAKNALDDFGYRFFTYNSEIHAGVYSKAQAWASIKSWLTGDSLSYTARTFVALVGALVVYLGWLFFRRPTRGVRASLVATDLTALALAQGAVAFASGIAQLRFWNHHLAAAMPWVGLLLGLAVEILLDRLRRPGLRPFRVRAVWLSVLVTVGFLATVCQNTWDREMQRRLGGWEPAGSDSLCKEIQSRTTAEDTIFIWGFDADLYVSCARNPASRFVYTTLIAGIVPPFWHSHRADRVARDASAQTVLDINRDRPALILDIPGKLGNASFRDVEALRGLLQRDYCKLGEFTGRGGRRATFYGRKDRGYCPKKAPQ